MAIDRSKVIYLDIKTWMGYSVGAEHYMGTLRCYEPYKTVEMQNKLTSRQAKTINKKTRTNLWQAGTMDERFESEDEIIEQARKEYKTHFPDAKILILGDSGYKAKRVLDGPPPDVIKRCNTLWELEERIPWHGMGTYCRTATEEEQSEKLYDEWVKLISDYLKG